MDYMKYYDENIDSSNKYTVKEKETIRNILMSLDIKKISEELKKQYMVQLESILFVINNLHDNEVNNNVIRPGYNRRLEVLLNVIKNENDNYKNIGMEEIEEQIEKFNKNYQLIVEKIEDVQDKFDTSVEIIDILKLKSGIVRIDNEFIKLFGNTGKNVNTLIDKINNFSNFKFSMSTDIVNEKINFVKNAIKELKLRYIKKYNAIVESTNNKIEVLRNKLDEETINKFQALKQLPVYEIPKNFAFNNKLKSVKNAKLIDNIKMIDKFNNMDTIKSSNVNNIFDLDKKIDELSNSIQDIENRLNNEESIITNKMTRKEITEKINKCEDEFDTYKEYIELYKDENRDKYNNTKLKINWLEKKIIDISIAYRSKCPFLVKRVKSAKDLYKKNEKLPLIASGLAGLSLIDFAIGPVIVPAIMCGNLMLLRKNAKFSTTLNGINKVLAKLIDAKKYGDGYILHTGVELNEVTASAAILKSIAINEGREWIAPLVYSAKNLFEKMKIMKLKESVSKGINKAKDKINTGIENVNEKISSSTKVRDTLVEIKELFKEFQKSKLSIDEFCLQNNISVGDKAMLEKINKKVMG